MSSAFGEARSASDPLACFDLVSLLDGAAGLRPDQIAFCDSSDVLTFEDAQSRACALAGCFHDLGLEPGETILVAAGAPAMSFVALVAAVRAGLRPAITPAWSEPAPAARRAQCAGAAAIVVVPGPALASAEPWLAAAAAAPSVRLVCALGGDPVDGALRIDPHDMAPSNVLSADAGEIRVCTFEGDAGLVPHTQSTLVAAALDIAARARIGVGPPTLSIIPPTSFAGLVAGPLVALIAGASIRWRIPFESRVFLHDLDELAPAHLVAPAALAPMLEAAGALTGGLASVVLISRRSDYAALAIEPPALSLAAAPLLVIDLYAVGERAAAAEARGSDGLPVLPVSEPHYLEFDGTRILALDWSNEDHGARRLEGAAVSDDCA